MTTTVPRPIFEIAETNDVHDTSWAWIDYSDLILRGSVFRGRSNELDQFGPSDLDLTLNNETGVLDPLVNTNLGVRRPCRLRTEVSHVTGVDLTGNSGTDSISTPDSATLQPSTAITVEWFGTIADMTPGATDALAAQWGPAGQRAWMWELRTDGKFQFSVSDDGTTIVTGVASTTSGVADGTLQWWRTAWRTSDNKLRFYKGGSDPDRPAWVVIGTDVTLTAGNIFNSNQNVHIGSIHIHAEAVTATVRKVIIRATFETTTSSVASVDFTADERWLTATTFLDPQGHTWTLNGSVAQITATTSYPRFWGYIDSIQQQFPGPNRQIAHLRATDGFGILSGTTLPSRAEQIAGGLGGLIHWYRLDEANNDGLYKDSVGSSYARPSGSVIASGQHSKPGLVAGDPDTCLQFIAANLDDITWDGTLGSGDAPIETAAWSICFWLKMTSLPGGGINGGIYEQAVGGGANPHVTIWVDESVHKMSAVIAKPGNTGVINDNTVLAADTTYFFTITYNGGSGAGAFKIYQGIGSTQFTAGLLSSPLTDFTVPEDAVLGRLAGAQYIDGYLDEIMIFNRDISQAEHESLYSAGSPADPDTFQTTDIVDEILDYADWPSTLRSYPDTTNAEYTFGVQFDSPEGRRALDYLQSLARTERGALYIDGDGQVVLESALWLASAVSRYQPDPSSTQATLGPDSGQIPYQYGVTYDQDEQPVRNDIRIDNTWVRFDAGIGTVVTESFVGKDAVSIQTHGDLTLSLQTKYQGTGTLASVQSELSARATLELERYAQPFVRFGPVVLVPDSVNTGTLRGQCWPAALGLNPLDQVTMTLDPPSGPEITRVRSVSSVRDDFTANPLDWRITLTLDLGSYIDP